MLISTEIEKIGIGKRRFTLSESCLVYCSEIDRSLSFSNFFLRILRCVSVFVYRVDIYRVTERYVKVVGFKEREREREREVYP